MPAPRHRHDVVVVGASLAGCSTAILFAREGLRVALVERSPDPNAYKKICTHYIQSSAAPVLARLGIDGAIARAGGVRNGVAFWSRWGWIRPADLPGDPRPRAYSIRRQTLDPLLRALAAAMPGVDFYPGETARGLLHGGGRVIGARLESARGRTLELRAGLIVAADGRHSRLAEMSRLPVAIRPHGRLSYFAHFAGVRLRTGSDAQMWMLDPDVAYAFPNDGGITVLACMPHRHRLSDFKRDLERQFASLFRQLPDGPDLSGAERVTPIMGAVDLPNVARPAAAAGLALVGDAAIASDPLWGVGCGWAFQSAAWLMDDTRAALQDGDPAAIDGALTRYRRHHELRLAGHHRVICDFATGRAFNAIERLFFSASVHDPVTARHFDAFGSRSISPAQFLSPRAVLRAAAVNLTGMVKRRPRSTPSSVGSPEGAGGC